MPFLNVEMRDTKSTVTGSRSDRHSLAEDTKTFSCSQNDANRLVDNQVLFLSLQSKSFVLIDIDNTKLSSCLKPVSLLVQIQHQHHFLTKDGRLLIIFMFDRKESLQHRFNNQGTESRNRLLLLQG